MLQEREHLIRYQEESDRTIRRLEREVEAKSTLNNDDNNNIVKNNSNSKNNENGQPIAQQVTSNETRQSIESSGNNAKNHTDRRPSIITGWTEPELEVRGTSTGLIRTGKATARR